MATATPVPPFGGGDRYLQHHHNTMLHRKQTGTRPMAVRPLNFPGPTGTTGLVDAALYHCRINNKAKLPRLRDCPLI
ncbi:hypothetical protein THS27_19425 [Thalassospira sp. MCCC 1A01428]|nr:hypothetical protein THS27_19425 [Thalassospira sp. MCCC 1A01428]